MPQRRCGCAIHGPQLSASKHTYSLVLVPRSHSSETLVTIVGRVDDLLQRPQPQVATAREKVFAAIPEVGKVPFRIVSVFEIRFAQLSEFGGKRRVLGGWLR